MMNIGGKMVMSGDSLVNSGRIVSPILDLTYKIIRGLDGMVHPNLQQAKFTGVESLIDLSLFVGLEKLTNLQFVNCPGLSCSSENFAAMADLLQSRVKIEVSGGDFLMRYNEYATVNGKIILPEDIHVGQQSYVGVQQLRHQVAYSGDDIPQNSSDMDRKTTAPENKNITKPLL